MDFVKFALQRILRMILCLIAVSVLTFTLLQLAPGNFADINSATSGSTGMDTGSTEQIGQQFNDRYGEDVPVVQQYLIFMKGAATWDMGPSYKYPNRTVEGMIAQGFPVSASLAVLAVALALALSIPIGVIAALRHRKLGDTGTMFLVTLGHALPSYLSAVFLIIIFAGWLQVLPAGGWAGPESMIMPVLAMGLGPLAVLSRYVRSAMLDTLSEEYVTAAYAKGGKPSTVVITHVLRNSLIPLITVSGPMLAGLMTGTLFIETMFRIPGLGLMFTQAAAARDMPLLMGSTMFFAIILMVTNLLVDLVYGLIDPRIRAESGRRLRVNKDSRGPSEKAQDSVTVASNLG